MLSARPPLIMPNGKRYAICYDFLDSRTHRGILQFVHDNTRSVQEAGVIGDREHRKAKIFFWFSPWDEQIRQRVAGIAPKLAHVFGLADPLSPPGPIETQLTISATDPGRNPHYFKRHVDSGSPETRERVLSYVIYLNTEPRRWRGGEIEVDGDVITPENNSVIFFPSDTWHAVLPTFMYDETDDIVHARITGNGWARRAGSPDPTKPPSY